MRDRRVVILGQPFWGDRIAGVLNEYSADLQAAYVPSSRYPTLLLDAVRSRPEILMRAGFRVGSPTPRGRAFDAYWQALCAVSPASRRWHYWLGTDVSQTLADVKSNRIRRRAFGKAIDDLHVADAPWLASELREVGIDAAAVPVPSRYQAPDIAPPMPGPFTVLTYMPGTRLAFYGGDAILGAARVLTAARFLIVGERPDPLPEHPDNVEWLGWVPSMSEAYREATVVVRIPEHDGTGATVVEGLMNARHVVYTHDMPHVLTVADRTSTALVGVLETLIAQHQAGALGPNEAGREFALEEYSEPRIARRLVRLLGGLER